MLPTIDIPKHSILLPVSKKKIEFRPFLVKEQKVLLQAIELGDEEQLTAAIEDIASACTFGKVDILKLPLADVEYLILQLRAKSVGETVELVTACGSCGKKGLPFNLILTDVFVDGTATDNRIMITDDVGVLMRDISYGDIKIASDMKNELDRGYKVILSSIESVFDKMQVYTRTDFTDADLFEWLDGASNTAFEKIEEYVANIPQIKSEVILTCPECGERVHVKLEGLEDFLA